MTLFLRNLKQKVMNHVPPPHWAYFSQRPLPLAAVLPCFMLTSTVLQTSSTSSASRSSTSTSALCQPHCNIPPLTLLRTARNESPKDTAEVAILECRSEVPWKDFTSFVAHWTRLFRPPPPRQWPQTEPLQRLSPPLVLLPRPLDMFLYSKLCRIKDFYKMSAVFAKAPFQTAETWMEAGVHCCMLPSKIEIWRPPMDFIVHCYSGKWHIIWLPVLIRPKCELYEDLDQWESLRRLHPHLDVEISFAVNFCLLWWLGWYFIAQMESTNQPVAVLFHSKYAFWAWHGIS